MGWDSDREMWVAIAAGQARRNLGRYRSSTAAALAVAISGGYPDRGVPHGARQTPAETAAQIAARDAACGAIERSLQTRTHGSPEKLPSLPENFGEPDWMSDEEM